MANYQNHLVDPTFFYDAIEEFAFDYDLYVIESTTIDELGNTKYNWTYYDIRGSLQSEGVSQQRRKSGNIDVMTYMFYCKSLYRISIGDVLVYKDRYLQVTEVNDYDEWGVRSCKLQMIQLSKYKDLAEYIKYLKGEILV